MATEPIVLDIFEPVTATWQYIVADPSTKDAVIIDSVLDFDPATRSLSSKSADGLLATVKENGLRIVKILETHAHADHLTAAKYLQSRLTELQGGLRPDVCIGKRIDGVQERFAAKYGVPKWELEGVFDKLFDDDEEFDIGELKAQALHLPGHTPDHLGYKIGDNVFSGDSLFNHDVGSARCDFPGGNAQHLFASVRRLLDLPDHTKIWTGHDYPPGGETGRKDPLSATTVAQQNEENKHLKKGVVEDEFVTWRRGRDAQLGEPRLLHYALQFNIRAGNMPAATEAGDKLLHVPLKAGLSW